MTSRRSRLRKLHQQARTARTSVPVSKAKGNPYLLGLGAAALALGTAALVNHRLASRAERSNPPLSQFVDVEGVNVHFVDQGAGDVLVLLHGNGTMIEDFASSGLIDLASEHYRVMAFDRPGFGHSDRPRTTIWSAEAQADLIHDALAELGVARATVLGYSWGCSVAVALGLKYPEMVGGLVLASGYYYPSVRADVVMSAGPAIPGIGDVMRFTVSPLLARLIWPLLKRKVFGPAPTPEKFVDDFPQEMTFRPSQIRASAADAALMIPDAFAASGRYSELDMPVVIVAGEEDRIVAIDAQSGRLHHDVPRSVLHRVPGAGHMVHQTAPEMVMACIDGACRRIDRTGKVVPFAA